MIKSVKLNGIVLLILLVTSLLVVSSWLLNPSTETEKNTILESVGYEKAFPSLGFTQPTLLLQRPRHNDRFYVLEKAGRIYFFENIHNVKEKHLYLDISQSLVDESYEGGLLGMAFDPGFKQNHYVYLSYTTSDNPGVDNSNELISRISRFVATEDDSKLIPESEQVLLSINQPWNNHNGGHIVFGPDGFLYAGYGDGGSWGDPNRNAQNTKTLLGSIIRIDTNLTIDEAAKGIKYKIPVDNPFSHSSDCENGAGCPEIYAWGMRNPWRWSFDRQAGKLWVGDVGQGEWEEINLVEKAGNYGWNCYEGSKDYRLKLCDKKKQYDMPVVAYSHMRSDSSRDGMAASVTGGVVYRGEKVKKLIGMYIYADFVHGNIWVIPKPYMSQPNSIELFDTDFSIVSFAEDQEGEVYFIDYMADGDIYRLVALGNQ